MYEQWTQQENSVHVYEQLCPIYVRTRQENSHFGSAAVQAILDGGAFKHICVCWCGGLKDSLSVGR